MVFFYYWVFFYLESLDYCVREGGKSFFSEYDGGWFGFKDCEIGWVFERFIYERIMVCWEF